ncbi:src-like-adapter isoform X2 [Brachyhypopomus gauderio]|uniref:src-like-adapter isoform X2 n=1 Tax=Brachyhypopomus gauderio TaxID=698409 RepID=UPI0040431068
MGNTHTSQRSRTDFTTSDDPTSRLSEMETAVVLSDYPPSEVCEPIFRTGDWLKVLSDEGYWWKVHSVQAQEENYIPPCYAAKVYHGWLFEGIMRQKAEELLWLPGNRVGSFLIRESKGGMYSLSVRHRTIMHYRIFRMPNKWYYISPRLTFQCLEDLVNHYSGNIHHMIKPLRCRTWSISREVSLRRECYHFQEWPTPRLFCPADIADGLCCVLTGPCLAATGLPSHVSSGRGHVSTWTTADRVVDQQDQQSAGDLAAYTDSSISYGVQESVSSYLSVAGADHRRKPSWKQKKWRSMYIQPMRQLRSMAMEDEGYEEVL